MRKTVAIIVTALTLSACDKSVNIPVTVQTVDASNVALLTRLDVETAVGDPVRMKETKQDGCTLLGTLTQDFGIDLKMVECGDKVTLSRSTSGHIRLDRAHTFVDAQGITRPGYDAGDKFLVPDVGVDFAKLHDAMTTSVSKQ